MFGELTSAGENVPLSAAGLLGSVLLDVATVDLCNVTLLYV